MALLQVENLSFRYPETKENALDGLSFCVQEGEFLVVCGKSGCGKTTLLKLLKRELTPHGEQTGEIRYNGTALSVLDARTAAGEIGFVLQNPEAQIVSDRVWHELAFGLESLGADTQTIRRRVAEMASYFGIQDWFRQETHTLSGGQKQMLNLASVMAMQPRLLLLDEPTSQLDPIAAADFIATLQKLNRELGLTIVLVEHRLEEVFPIADRVMLLERGQISLLEAPRVFAEQLCQTDQTHEMFAALPSAVRLYSGLDGDGPCPLTVKEGRRFLAGRFPKRKAPPACAPADFPPAQPVLQLRQAWFRYERETPDILRGIDISIYPGEIFCLLGGNGAGKTTALQLLAGVERPYRGKLLLAGKPVRRGGQALPMALLPQDPLLIFQEKSVRADFEEMRGAAVYEEREWEKAVSLVSRRLGIEALLDRHPYDLSGGEQQKAALAKLLLSKPKILLLDEPTKGIDAFAKRTLAGILREWRAEGVAIVIVTHDVEFAAADADRCALLFDGEIVSEAPPGVFFSNNHFYTTAANRIARDFCPGAVTCEAVAAALRCNSDAK